MTKRTTSRIEVPKTDAAQQLDSGGQSENLTDGRGIVLTDTSAQGFRNLLVLGAGSPQGAEANRAYFQSLRTRARFVEVIRAASSAGNRALPCAPARPPTRST